jgi:hypothetical protein
MGKLAAPLWSLQPSLIPQQAEKASRQTPPSTSQFSRQILSPVPSTNADSTYFAAPQDLLAVVIDTPTSLSKILVVLLNPTKALDATQFAFFKGINDAGNGNGSLSAVDQDLPVETTVCTMASSSNHQPVIMFVAQRGTADRPH